MTMVAVVAATVAAVGVVPHPATRVLAREFAVGAEAALTLLFLGTRVEDAYAVIAVIAVRDDRRRGTEDGQHQPKVEPHLSYKRLF